MHVAWLKDLRMADLPRVGGKNASLGEMIGGLSRAGVRVPGGYATTAVAFQSFLAASGLERRIADRIKTLDTRDMDALARCGAEIRGWIEQAPFPADVENEISSYYQQLVETSSGGISFAVRSSATAEDLPDASFAGQQETFLNIRGADHVLAAIRHVYASLYNDRAISYRAHQGFEHGAVAISAAVQRMVRSDRGASGVMFTLDTESGFSEVVFITSSWGLGEMVVQGSVNPDEFYVHKPMLAQGNPAILRRRLGSKLQRMVFADQASAGRSVRKEEVAAAERERFSLSDGDVLELARTACLIEQHYGRSMDIEWGKDGVDGSIHVLQARPETVRSRKRAGAEESYRLKGSGELLVSGRAIGQKIGAGPVKVVKDASRMASKQFGRAQDAAIDAFDETEAAIRRNPLSAIAIALGIGFLLGVLAARR